MPLIYRSMQKDGDRPKLGRTAKTLGVRIPGDIAVDATGHVSPGTGGMSVVPAWRLLKSHRIPMRLRHFCPDATGKTDLSCWKMGEGEFKDGPLAPGLSFRRDTPMHGLVEPAQVVSLADFEADLAATRDQWTIDET
jgi:hypothetical protein